MKRMHWSLIPWPARYWPPFSLGHVSSTTQRWRRMTSFGQIHRRMSSYSVTEYPPRWWAAATRVVLRQVVSSAHQPLRLPASRWACRTEDPFPLPTRSQMARKWQPHLIIWAVHPTHARRQFAGHHETTSSRSIRMLDRRFSTERTMSSFSQYVFICLYVLYLIVQSSLLQKDDLEPMPGYLSLHAESYGLIIKWTPNQLINGRPSQNSAESNDSIFSHSSLDKR